jgi:hypothetical protein
MNAGNFTPIEKDEGKREQVRIDSLLLRNNWYCGAQGIKIPKVNFLFRSLANLVGEQAEFVLFFSLG